MKKHFYTTLLILSSLLISINSFAQNKKEQIVILQTRIDSLKNVNIIIRDSLKNDDRTIQEQNEKINNYQQTVNEKTEEINSLKKEAENTNDKLQLYLNEISKLNEKIEFYTDTKLFSDFIISILQLCSELAFFGSYDEDGNGQAPDNESILPKLAIYVNKEMIYYGCGDGSPIFDEEAGAEYEGDFCGGKLCKLSIYDKEVLGINPTAMAFYALSKLKWNFQDFNPFSTPLLKNPNLESYKISDVFKSELKKYNNENLYLIHKSGFYYFFIKENNNYRYLGGCCELP